MPHANRTVAFLVTLLGLSFWTPPSVLAQSCVVLNTADSTAAEPTVPGSLRDCLERGRAGDTITFDANIFDLTNSDAATVINVRQPLPPLDDGNVTIDASDRRVTINGSGTVDASGLVITSNGNTVRGLQIIGFPRSGVQITSASNNVIGGNATTGTGPNGQGLRLGASNNGVEIAGSGSDLNVVKGCWIGLDASGTSSEPNLTGIAVHDGPTATMIGGVVAGEGNVISGNLGAGIAIEGPATDDNVVVGNIIGESATADASGRRTAIGNGSAGVFLSRGTQRTQIGGDDPGEGNVVANNGGNGVEVRAADSRRNSARGNRITKNASKGIALFDGSNDGIQPPVITSIQDLGPSGAGTGSTLRLSGTTTGAGSVEVFNDPGSQGATLVRRSVSNGTFEADIDVSDVLNRTATFTDAVGNTSPFGVFGLTAGDADGDGVSSVLETLAQTDPGNPLDTPALVGTLNPTKLQVKLNFAKASKDSLKATISLSLPSGFVVAGATIGVQVAGHAEQLVLDAKGKASGTGKMALKIAKGTFDGVLKYAVKDASLLAEVATFGLAEKTTPKSGEGWVLPVAVTTDGSVYLGSATLTYKATQGKTGKAKK